MRLILCLVTCWVCLPASGAETWQHALAQMPLPAGVKHLRRTNCIPIMLNAFQSNDVVKAVIFMPGATDEFYMFKRAEASLTNSTPSMLDAVVALTNQTFIRATFHAPFLLLHSDEDPLEVVAKINDATTAEKIRQKRFANHIVYFDRDWDSLVFPLQKTFGVWVTPKLNSPGSWHFYRHSLAGWNLTGWEALQAICLAGKTGFTVERKKVVFEGDERALAEPKLDRFPR